MAMPAKIKRDPTGEAEVEGRNAVFRAAFTATTATGTDSLTMRNAGARFKDKKKLRKHPHRESAAGHSHRAA